MTETTQNQANHSKRAKAQAEATCHLVPAAPALDHGNSKGAPPSNTAPANCIDGIHHILRTGVDSLYLSFKGDLFE